MTNANKFKESFISKALPVPANTPAGAVLPLGTGGLRAITKTTRATTATIAAGTAAPGLVDGQATCVLLGCVAVLNLALVTSATQFAPIYHLTAGTYTTDSGGTGAVLIGYAVQAIGSAGNCQVAIV